MKRTTVCLFVILTILASIPLIRAQESEKKLYRIYATTPDQVKRLAQQGFDIYNIEPGVSIDVLALPDRVAQLGEAQLKIEVIAENFKELIEREYGEQLSQFHNYATTYQELTAFAHDAEYPPIARLDTIGHSVARRVIGALKVSDNPDLTEDEPVILFAGCHHGNELLSIEAPLTFIRYLMDHYGYDPVITRWVDSYEIWFIPLVNPDGREAFRRHNNSDVDLNRNYSFQFIPGGTHGPEPFSEPETRAVRDFAAQHPPVLSLTYHTYGELVLYSWTHTDGIAPDNDVLIQVGGTVADSLNYTLRQGGRWYFTEGEYCDFMYGVHGCLAFTIEMYTSHPESPVMIDEVMARNLPGFIAMMNLAEKSGITGLVTDAETGAPIQATIDILEIDDQDLLYPRMSNLQFGRFYRYLTPAQYTVKISAAGYESIVYRDVPVTMDSLIVLDAQLISTAYLSVAAMRIDDDSLGVSAGNGDGNLNNAETIRLSLTVANQQPIPASQVYASLSTENSNVEFLCDSLFIGEVGPNSSVSLDSFLFRILPSAADSEKVELILRLRETSGMEWSHQFLFEVFAPTMSLEDVTVNDLAGNQNGVLNNGETVQLIFAINNNGRQSLTDLVGVLSANDAYLEILQDTVRLSRIAMGQTVCFSFDVHLKETTPQFYTVDTKLAISAPQKSGFQKHVPINNVDGLFDNFEFTVDGWVHKSWMLSANYHDDWQRGRPQGKGGDPRLPYSGMSCWGTDMGYDDYEGLSWDGCYQASVNNYLLSPVIDCRGLSDVGLRFMRWLNVAAGDEARVRVNYQIVWESPANGLRDAQWQEQLIDISAYADNRASVRIMFELQSNSDNVIVGGWNIDDFLVTGDLVSGVAEKPETDISADYRLYENYPNPFNPLTHISFQLPARGFVDLKIYDILGREIRSLVQDVQEAGVHQVAWDGNDESGNAVASGVYFCRMKSSDFGATRKLLLLK
ncbi:MAG: M14 family zinc carboxypeptidase [Candidatus Zhuqueibacterota bacterium]